MMALMPRRVKKRRLNDGDFEEYMDWVFRKDDESIPKLGRLLEIAQTWKAEQAGDHDQKQHNVQ